MKKDTEIWYRINKRLKELKNKASNVTSKLQVTIYYEKILVAGIFILFNIEMLHHSQKRLASDSLF